MSSYRIEAHLGHRQSGTARQPHIWQLARRRGRPGSHRERTREGAQKTGTTTHGTVCVAIVAMATVPEEVKGRERLVHTMPSRIDYLRMFRHIRRCTEVLHGFFVLYQELSMLRSPQSIALNRRRSQIDGVHRRVYDPSIKRIFSPIFSLQRHQ